MTAFKQKIWNLTFLHKSWSGSGSRLDQYSARCLQFGKGTVPKTSKIPQQETTSFLAESRLLLRQKQSWSSTPFITQQCKVKKANKGHKRKKSTDRKKCLLTKISCKKDGKNMVLLKKLSEKKVTTVYLIFILLLSLLPLLLPPLLLHLQRHCRHHFHNCLS